MTDVLTFLRIGLLFAISLTPIAVAAQSGGVAFGNSAQDRSSPVEVTADNLDVDQENDTAVFTGNVVIVQGEMRLAAPKVRVVYLKDRSGIKTLRATGGAVLVSGEDAAEANQADYNVQTGMIEMQGNVLLVQGDNTIAGNHMTVDVTAGTAKISGRVKTILLPESNSE